MIRRLLSLILVLLAIGAFIWGGINQDYSRHRIDIGENTIVLDCWNREFIISFFRVADANTPGVEHSGKMGFRFYRARFFMGPGRSYSRTVYTVFAPRWFVVSLLGAYPLIALSGSLKRRWRNRRRRRRGLCLQCGYNLTGVPEPRCPECGTAQIPKESRIGLDDRASVTCHAPVRLV